MRQRDAPIYLSMDRNRFNGEVSPSLTEIPIGEQGIAFDRFELDAWVDEYGMTWLSSAPHIKLLSDTNKRKPYPLSWKAQDNLLSLLPNHISDMAIFAVNTGCRDGEICNLQWSLLVPVRALNTAWIRARKSANLEQEHLLSILRLTAQAPQAHLHVLSRENPQGRSL
jgi:integrase